ncbi:MAG: cell division protein FtsB [Xanthomonadales bacterium]|nr:cell division protein FtsB [Xanthomonadales bacterium]MBK7146831.1 cell division protein FtsB [Xanthomonadales bacterium]MCC6562120.1 cell division protein FtsB [Xanthomonadales bacterium]
MLGLIVLLIGLQAKLWFGQGGRPEVQHLQERVATQRRENAELRKRKEALAAEVEDLKSGTEAIEERARSELGMIKPGEVFYQVVEPEAPAKESE